MDRLCLPLGRSCGIQHISRTVLALFICTISTSFAAPQKPDNIANNKIQRWTIDNCFSEERNYDVTFVIDAAESRENFRYVQRFVIDTTRRLKLLQSKPKIGFITYGVRVVSIRFKKRWRHHGELRDAILALKPVTPLRRNVGKAVYASSQTVNPRSSTRSFIVLMVGGKSMDNAVRQALLLYRRKAKTIIVGYDQANVTELKLMAESAGTQNLLFVKSSDELVTVTDSILSMICEDMLNADSTARTGIKKQAITRKPTFIKGPQQIVSSPKAIHLQWENNTPPLSLAKYRVTWLPKDGSVNLTTTDNSSSVVLRELNPATIYKIRFSPIAKRNFIKPLTVIAATSPLPVANLTAQVKYVEPCTFQKKLQKRYRGSKIGVVLKPSDCEKLRAVLFVDWDRTSTSKYFMMNTEPSVARLIRVTRRSTEQYFTNMKAGAEYKLSVITRGPRLLDSEPKNTSIIIPPLDPIRLDAAIINSSTVAVRWQMPRDAIYDGFRIKAISAFGFKFFRVEAEVPGSNITFRPFYSFVLHDLRPDTDYIVTIFTESQNVLSLGYMNTTFTTKTPSDLYSEPFLIISARDGIYAATAGNEPGNSVQRLFPVSGGVVNALYHSRWVRPKKHYESRPGFFQWQKLLIWIERHTREIKVTDLTSQSHTVTLVSGLLQPVGLAIDSYGGTIYWTDIGSRSIGVVSLSNKPGIRSYQANRYLITGDLESPVSITVGVVERYLFWGDLQGHIERSNLDGTQRKILLKREGLAPYSITFCEKSKTLYWIDANSGNLEGVMSSGEDHRVIYNSGSEHIIALVLAGQHYIWFDESGTVRRLGKDPEPYEEPLVMYQDSDAPAVTAMTSFDPDSLEKGNDLEFTTLDLLLSLMRESSELSFPCHMSETFCTGVCIPVTMKDAVCTSQCKPWQMICYRSAELKCIDHHLTCNGIMDCEYGEDEDLPECEQSIEEGKCEAENITSAYGCHDTGECISYELVCNGRLDCKDGSDEMDCPFQEQSCDFDSKDFCLWRQATEDDFDWMLHSRKTPSNLTGPVIDHSMLSSNGTYIYLEATPQDEGDTAQLISVLFAKPVCISFYYYLHGDTVGTLHLWLRDRESGKQTILWSKSGEHGAVWNKVMVSVDKHILYELVIEGVRGFDYRGDIAIDDIIIKDGLCNVPKQCDFHSLDDAMCGYTLGAHWQQVSGDITIPGAEPGVIERSKPMTQDLTTVLGPEWFYHDFKSDDFPGCTECFGTRLVRDISNSEFARNGANYVGISLCSRKKYKIYLSETLSGPFRNIGDGAGKGEDHCEFLGSSDYAKEIGTYRICEGETGFVRRRWGESLEIDDYGFYRSVYFAPASYQCDFQFPQEVIDNDPKTWLEELSNSYLYLDLASLMESETLVSDSIKIPVFLSSHEDEDADVSDGPLTIFDMFPKAEIELDYEEIQKKSSHPNSWCLKFRYFMIGSDVKSLIVSVGDKYDVWVKNNGRDENWMDATIDIPYPAVKYDLIITAARGSGYEGSFGIDDVDISHASCNPRISYRCSFDVPVDEDCSFEILEAPSEQITLAVLYKRTKYEPNIVRIHEYSSGVMTGEEVIRTNGTTITSSPVLRSPLLPRLNRFYPVLCLTVHYRQRSDFGVLSVRLVSGISGRSYLLSSYKLPSQKSLIRPWLTYIAQINESYPVASEEPFYIEFRGLNATWVNELSVDTIECPAVVEDLCSNKVRCSNGLCVSPELLCDGINDCGDWSDEVGCSSECGNIADYFEIKQFIKGQNEIESNVCTYRIHGQPGKQTLLTVGAVTNQPPSSHITLKVYKGFMKRSSGQNSGFFPNGSLVFKIDEFSKKTDYLIESYDITVIVEYTNTSLKPVSLSYEMVEEGHCSLVCPDHHCLFSNRYCDGKIGCSDGSDESDCARVVEKDGVEVLEIRYLDGPFAPVCADDVTELLADTLCKQLNDLSAERPLKKTRLPASYDGILPHKLMDDYLISDVTLIQSLIARPSSRERIIGNATFPVQSKKTIAQCKSRDTWIPKCISYQCGVKPIDVNPFLSGQGNVSPILRIIGGEKSRKGLWPWMGSMQLNERDHNCGATLISDRFAITAAHCFDEHDATLFTMLLGSHTIRNHGREATKHAVKRAIIHGSYNKNADIPDWDIALVELDPPVHFSTYVSPICLPHGNIEFPPGTQCYITGFGHISEGRGSQNVLMEAETPIISNAECDTDMYRGSITERMVCAGYPSTGGVGICHGDSGGPLMCEKSGSWFLVGVTSWSIGCANKGKPDVFSRILSHIGWINEETGFNLTLPDRSRPVLGTCGGTYYGSLSGTFASPGWPKKYFNDQDCYYTILADMGQTIHLRFEEFETERYFDFIEVFSGNLDESNKIAQHSGLARPDSLNVRSSAVHVYFKSDESSSEKGFVGNWEISGRASSYEGPGYPIEVRLRGLYAPFMQFFTNDYLGTFVFSGIGKGGWPFYLQHPPRTVSHKLEYVPQIGYWVIRTLDDHKPGTATGMRTQCVRETPDLCNSTWQIWVGINWMDVTLRLDVKEGVVMSAPSVIPVSKEPSTTTTTTTTTIPTTLAATTLTTASDSLTCGGILTSPTGNIVSPGYGVGNYSNNLNCEWFIDPPKGNEKSRWFLLEIIQINTQDVFDVLQGFPGNRTNAAPLFGLSGDHVHLDDGSENQLEITPLLESRDEVEPSLDLAAFGFSLDDDDTESEPTPEPTQSSSTITTVLKYEDVNSEGITLTFTTDDSITDKGFMLRYYVLDNLSNSPLNTDKYVTIEVFEDEELARRKRSIQADSDSGIDFSYYLEDGSGLWEGPSGDYYEYYDYTASINDVKPDPKCDFTTTLNSTYVIQYSAKDDNPKLNSVKNCLWKLKTVDPTQKINLNITLDPYTAGVISYLFLAGNDDDDNMFRVDIAPSSSLNEFLTATGEISIHFSTDGKKVGFNLTASVSDHVSPTVVGFLSTTESRVGKAITQPTPATTTTAVYGNSRLGTIQITSTCKNVTGDLGDDQFFIQSPNHPDSYPANVVCTWVMKAHSTQKIAITFSRMAIEEVSSDCSYDNVTVYDGEMNSKPVGVFCGTNLPEPIISSRSIMVVRFATDGLVHDTGFRAVITTLQSSLLTQRMMEDSVLFSCDFDNEDICGFTHGKSDDIDFTWTKHTLQTPSDNTGPTHDASKLKDGYYLFIEASMPRLPGDRARLLSPVMPSQPTKPLCLSFAYSMRGLTVGTLIVYANIASDGATALDGLEDTESQSQSIFNLRPIVTQFGAGMKQERMFAPYMSKTQTPEWQQYVLWSKTGEQGEKSWSYANVTFTPNNNFQLIFEGIRGSEYQSDIAIDSIIVRHGACENVECGKNQFQCDTGTMEDDRPICISKELECDGHYDCDDGSDETQCSSPLQELCERMPKLSPNTTEWLICNHVEKCNPTSVNIGHVKDIACDGTYDCFGGYDESLCDIMNEQEVEITENEQDECGKQNTEDEELTERSDIHNIDADVMPWVGGLYIHIPESDSFEESFFDESSRYIFLCSAVFIKESWLLAPAHCILDPEMTKKDLVNFLYHRNNPEGVIKEVEEENEDFETEITEPPNRLRYDDPLLSEFGQPNEYHGLYKDEFLNDDILDQSETVFEYYVIMPSNQNQADGGIYKVSKLVPHPEYTILKHLQDCNSTSKSKGKKNEEQDTTDAQNESINCDVTRINYDVTLLKIERENGGGDFDDTELESRISPKACINTRHLPQTTTSSVVDVATSSPLNNMFHPPSEDVAYEKSFKLKATCYEIGFSFPQGGDESVYELVLSRKSVRLAYGDKSAAKIVCGLQSPYQPSTECIESFKEDTEFQPLLVGGYSEVRNLPFMYDQGPVLMCKSWDERWYLTGLYSWSNMYRNLLREKLYEVVDDGYISGGVLEHGAVIGQPLGVNLFTDVSHLSDWVENTLDEDCPGEFPCYDKSSNIPQKCIGKQRRCDGIIDCPLNFLDEIDCPSGCSYEPNVDPLREYYMNLDEYGIGLPDIILEKYNLSKPNTSFSGQFKELEEKNSKSIIVFPREDMNLFNASNLQNNEKSWRTGDKPGKIQANVVTRQNLKMCIWTIKAPAEKVSVLQIKEFSAVRGGNKIQIINGEKREILRPGMGDAYYTSQLGGTISVRILPPPGQPYLKEIRYFEANHNTEAHGICKNRHKCGDGTCVSPHHICDGIWDCEDKSDEFDCDSGCGGLAFISGPSSGIISSKNYPFSHSGNGDCEWQFVPKTSGEDKPTITFEFLDFSTDDKDELFLFSGAGVRKLSENLAGVFSGVRESFSFTLEAHSATLLLRSNDFISSRKIRIKYSMNTP